MVMRSRAIKASASWGENLRINTILPPAASDGSSDGLSDSGSGEGESGSRAIRAVDLGQTVAQADYDDDGEDDLPLALKLAVNGKRVEDEDDVPLGVRASMLSGLGRDFGSPVKSLHGANDVLDDDDVPLGLSALGQQPSMDELHQQQQAYIMQQQVLAQAEAQRQMAFQLAMQQQQQHASMAYHVMPASSDPALLQTLAPAGGAGPGSRVENWRRGVPTG